MPEQFSKASKCLLIRGGEPGSHVSNFTGTPRSMENTSLTARKAGTSIGDGFPILWLQRRLNEEEIADLFPYNILLSVSCRSKASGVRGPYCSHWSFVWPQGLFMGDSQGCWGC